MNTDTNNFNPSELEKLQADVEENAIRLDDIYESVEKTRKYFLTTMIINIVVFVIPLIIAAIVVPTFLDNYTGALNGAGF